MTEQGKINLNTASHDELARIQGIGDECADILINYREEHGGINDIDELDHIPGFGAEAMRNLKQQATV